MLDVRAEGVPQALVPALTDQVQVDFADGRQVAVGIVHDLRLVVLVGHLETVVRHVAALDRFHHGHPHAARFVRHGHRACRRDDGDGFRQVLHGPDRDVAVVIKVGTEDRVGSVVFAGPDPRQGFTVHGQWCAGPIDTC